MKYSHNSNQQSKSANSSLRSTKNKSVICFFLLFAFLLTFPIASAIQYNTTSILNVSHTSLDTDITYITDCFGKLFVFADGNDRIYSIPYDLNFSNAELFYNYNEAGGRGVSCNETHLLFTELRAGVNDDTYNVLFFNETGSITLNKKGSDTDSDIDAFNDISYNSVTGGFVSVYNIQPKDYYANWSLNTETPEISDLNDLFLFDVITGNLFGSYNSETIYLINKNNFTRTSDTINLIGSIRDCVYVTSEDLIYCTEFSTNEIIVFSTDFTPDITTNTPPNPAVNIYPANTTITLNSTGVTIPINWSGGDDNDSDTTTTQVYLDLLGSYTFISNTTSQTTSMTLNNTQTTSSYYSIYLNITDAENYTISEGEYFRLCVNDWTAYNSTCESNLQTLLYNDSNTCPLAYDVPDDNGSISACDTTTTAPASVLTLDILIYLIILATCLILMVAFKDIFIPITAIIIIFGVIFIFLPLDISTPVKISGVLFSVFIFFGSLWYYFENTK